MAGIPKLNYYKKLVCSNCNYSWDYPFSNKTSMTPVQALFYFEVHICPHCLSTGAMITEVGEFELKVQQDKDYKQILKNRNMAFATVCRKETYRYLLYANICEKKGDYYEVAKAYYMAKKVEKFQRRRYIESMLYNEKRDAKLLKQSEENEQLYLEKSINAMATYLSNHENLEARIMLAVLYKIAFNGDDALKQLNYVMKQEVTQEQIVMVKEVMSMELGPSDFLKVYN